MQLLQLFALSLSQEVGAEEESMYRGRQGSVGTDRVPVCALQLLVNCVLAQEPFRLWTLLLTPLLKNFCSWLNHLLENYRQWEKT